MPGKNNTILYLSIVLITLMVAFLAGLYINRNGLIRAIDQIGANTIDKNLLSDIS